MHRQASQDRFWTLLDTATQVFIAQGYRRTQVADIASAMGVAKGTLYLYVESKEALFDLALRHALSSLAPPETLPVPTPEPGSTLAAIATELAQTTFPHLTQALSAVTPNDVRAELMTILQEIYDTLSNHRIGIKLVDRCAHDYPDLAALWFTEGREQSLGLLIEYLNLRREHLQPMLDTPVVARIILETLTFWAVHRHWDPAPQTVDEALVTDTVIQFLRQSLIQEDNP